MVVCDIEHVLLIYLPQCPLVFETKRRWFPALAPLVLRRCVASIPTESLDGANHVKLLIGLKHAMRPSMFNFAPFLVC
jgi:hypothetical protein